MYYNTIQELDALLTQHFQNKEPYSLEHKLVTDEIMQIIIKDGDNIVYNKYIDTKCSDVYPQTNKKALKDWFYDQWFNFKQKSQPLPSKQGPHITLGDKVFVTDPCYKPDTWCAAVLDNVRPGEWCTEMDQLDEGGGDERVSALVLWHSDFEKPSEFEETEYTIGVDSGQAGVVDYDHFIQLNNDESTKDDWYDSIETMIRVRKQLPPAALYKLEEYKNLRLQLSEALQNKELTEIERLKQFQKYYTESSKLENQYKFTSQSCIDSKYDDFDHQIWTDGLSAITSTGWGDGSYDLSIAKDGDQIVGMKITYISDDEDDE